MKSTRPQNLWRPKLWPTASKVLGLKVSALDHGPSLRGSGDDLEETLVEVCDLALSEPALPNLLATWVVVHGQRVRTEKLNALAKAYRKKHGRKLFWLCVLAHFAVSKGHKKWALVAKSLNSEASMEQPAAAKAFAEVVGTASFLQGTGLYVTEKSLRVRDEDVDSVEALAQKSLQYRLRILYGSEVRADVRYAMMEGASSAKEVSKRVFCGRSTAEILFKDFSLFLSIAASKRDVA